MAEPKTDQSDFRLPGQPMTDYDPICAACGLPVADHYDLEPCPVEAKRDA